MKIPEAVIFDMDGVLIDSEPIHYDIENKLFLKLGIVVPEAVHLSYLGASNEFMYSDIKSRFELVESLEELMEADDLFRCDLFKHREGIPLNVGVLRLLRQIKSAGLKIAVATSSSPEIANILLNKCGIAPFFDAIVTTSEAGASKPLPDVYILAAQRIGVAPANCIVFEDSPNGLLAAKSAGMYCIVIQSDDVIIRELSNADYRIKTFNEITPGKLFEIFEIK